MNEQTSITLEELEFLKLQYQVLANRQQSHNAFVWSVPALLFTAESILWSIVLGGAVSGALRCIVSFLSALIAFASWQQFERGRLLEIADSEQLYAIERIMRQLNAGGMIIHHTLDRRTIFVDGTEDAVSADGVLSKTVRTLKTHLEDTVPFARTSLLSRFGTFQVWRVVFIFTFAFSTALFLYQAARLLAL